MNLWWVKHTEQIVAAQKCPHVNMSYSVHQRIIKKKHCHLININSVPASNGFGELPVPYNMMVNIDSCSSAFGRSTPLHISVRVSIFEGTPFERLVDMQISREKEEEKKRAKLLRGPKSHVKTRLHHVRFLRAQTISLRPAGLHSVVFRPAKFIPAPNPPKNTAPSNQPDACFADKIAPPARSLIWVKPMQALAGASMIARIRVGKR